jgi:hypothetical protein
MAVCLLTQRFVHAAAFGSSSFGDEGAEVPFCGCQQPAVVRTSSSTANPGRQFYTCARPREEQCGLFIWGDEWDGNPNPPIKRKGDAGGGGGGYGFSGGSAAPRGGGGSAGAGGNACFKCGQPGHFASNCPQGGASSGGGWGGGGGGGGSSGSCYKCGQPGHFSNNCPQGGGGGGYGGGGRGGGGGGYGSGGASSGGNTCYKCGQPGHFANNCKQGQGGMKASGAKGVRIDHRQRKELVREPHAAHSHHAAACQGRAWRREDPTQVRQLRRTRYLRASSPCVSFNKGSTHASRRAPRRPHAQELPRTRGVSEALQERPLISNFLQARQISR